MSFRPIRARAVAALAALLLAATACGSSGDASDTASADDPTPSATATPSASPTSSPSPTSDGSKHVQVTFTADGVDPLGKVVKLDVGQPLVLQIEAESAGELHVHSTPEQEISYPAGASSSRIVIDRPGVVEVESHDLHKLVLQLEVR